MYNKIPKITSVKPSYGARVHFNVKCQHCGEILSTDVDSIIEETYREHFTLVCRHCNKVIGSSVSVLRILQFYLDKKPCRRYIRTDTSIGSILVENEDTEPIYDFICQTCFLQLMGNELRQPGCKKCSAIVDLKDLIQKVRDRYGLKAG